ncbi:MAG TPA: hypothetical protein VKT72_00010 [Candidatus Baltobacteraceae bacterium]|nr:hypothetical protein [Candidatus Baltobacteraceae bacterium]
MNTRVLAAVPFGAILVLATRGEPHAQQLPAAPDAQTIINRVLERNPLLESFETRVHVRVRMLNFPWISLHLDGTSYFKRPSAYDVVFDRVPNYASSVKRILADVADPLEWERDWTVTAARASANGLPLFELRMTKPAPGTLSEQDAFIDPLTYVVTRMEWHYTNGGSVAMTQTYRSEGGYTLIASQHADIRFPHVRAVADASYDAYQTNVALDARVFQAHQ